MKENKKTTTVSNEVALEQATSSNDLMIAILIVSVVINAFLLTGWIALKVTSQYDAQVAGLLFN